MWLTSDNTEIRKPYYCLDCQRERRLISKHGPNSGRVKKRKELRNQGLCDCVTCNKILPIEQFAKYNKLKTGYRTICIECKKKRDRKSVLRFKYNLTFEQFDNMLVKQEYKCKICNYLLDFSFKNKKVHIDHCHTTGKVRGILCGPCNAGLGMLKENINILKNAITYLENAERNKTEN